MKTFKQINSIDYFRKKAQTFSVSCNVYDVYVINI